MPYYEEKALLTGVPEATSMVSPRSGSSEGIANRGMIPWMWKLVALVLILREVVQFRHMHDTLPLRVSLETSKNISAMDQFAAELVTIEEDSAWWCPTARCSATGHSPENHQEQQPMCNLCGEKFLIIISLGRSASTTLTWTLDTLPGIRMGGENNGAINKFKDLMDDTAYLRNMKNGEGIRNHPWGHAPFEEQNLLCAAQGYIQALYPRYNDTPDTDTILGFKTVRFLEGHSQHQDAAYLQFMTKVFPCARFVVNYRGDTEALQHSFATAFKSPNANTGEIQELIARSQWIADQLGPERAYQLDSSEWTSNVTKLNSLVRWLGYGPECDFEDVLELNTKNGGYGNGKERLEHTNPNCEALSG